MATETRTISERIVGALSNRPATKIALANRLNLSYAVIHKNVNALLADGKVELLRSKQTGKRGRPAGIFGIPSA